MRWNSGAEPLTLDRWQNDLNQHTTGPRAFTEARPRCLAKYVIKILTQVIGLEKGMPGQSVQTVNPAHLFWGSCCVMLQVCLKALERHSPSVFRKGKEIDRPALFDVLTDSRPRCRC